MLGINSANIINIQLAAVDGPSIKRLAALTLAALSWMLYTEQDPVKVVSIKSVKWSPVCTP